MDGDVDVADWAIQTQNWTGALELGDPNANKTFAQGDSDGDGDVDAACGVISELGLEGIVTANTTVKRVGLSTDRARVDAVGAGVGPRLGGLGDRVDSLSFKIDEYAHSSSHSPSSK